MYLVTPKGQKIFIISMFKVPETDPSGVSTLVAVAEVHITLTVTVTAVAVFEFL